MNGLNTFIEFQKALAQINENNFDEIAWRIFEFQSANNEVYRTYIKHLKVDLRRIKSLNEIPFMPVRFFKNLPIKTGEWPTQRIYLSSGTTEAIRSSHHLWDENFYLTHAASTFEKFFDLLDRYNILALLPSYDTGQSSLVAMIRHFIGRSQSQDAGFFLNDLERLINRIQSLKSAPKKSLLIGVSHALLDLAALGPFTFENLWVMETGGMKGRKEEITRSELHEKIKAGLGIESVSSEYGMTELCSQAYSLAEGMFQCPPTMKVIVKEVNDPFLLAKTTGIINIIDLANFHSCSFIETQDLGRVTANRFEVLGRVDNSEVRGCNLLIA